MSEGVVAAASNMIKDLHDKEEVTIDNLTKESLPGHIVFACGVFFHTTQSQLTNFRVYVSWLREKGIRLHENDMETVQSILKKSKNGAVDEKSIKRYARSLRALLSCREDELPEKFTITNACAVPVYYVEDLVDGQFEVIGEQRRAWYSGVVVDKRDTRQAKPYLVFWLGQEPCSSDNPQWISGHLLRQHAEDGICGKTDDWLDVPTITKFYNDAKQIKIQAAADKAAKAAKAASEADAANAAKAASASSDHNSEGGKNPNARDPQPSNASNGRDRRPKPAPYDGGESPAKKPRSSAWKK